MTRNALFIALVFATGCDKKPSEPAAKPAETKPTEAKPVEAVKPAEVKPAEPAPAALTWEKFTSKTGGFTIELPGKADEKDQGGLKIVGAEFGTSAADDRTSMCGAAYMEMPAKPADAKVVLDGATARHKENAKVIEDKEITLGKYPGRALIVQNDTHRKWMRVYLVDKTIYILNCGGPFDRGDVDQPTALKVLESFALTK